MDRSNFPSSLHFHDYYEVVVILGGEIRYVCESVTVKPERCDVIVIPPGKFHMSLIAADETQYVRQVFYLYPDAFSDYQCDALLNFFNAVSVERFSFSLSPENQKKLLALLSELEHNAQQHTAENHALILSNVLQIFYLFNQPIEAYRAADEYLPSSLIEIQDYIDNHFTQISSIADIAQQTFYTREHVSRLFKKYKKITVAEYILKRRISYSCQLMKTSLSLTDICFKSGFGSIPAFIRAFKQAMGTTPSAYRNKLNASEEMLKK